MTNNEPNYRQISPPTDKPYEEFSYVERRAAIYNLIEQAGHYRNIEQSYRELGDRFGVSHQTIKKDIDTINEWIADNLGNNAESELSTLKNAAVQDLISRGEYDKAYRLMREHYELLQDMGLKDREAQEVDMNWRDYVEQNG